MMFIINLSWIFSNYLFILIWLNIKILKKMFFDFVKNVRKKKVRIYILRKLKIIAFILALLLLEKEENKKM